MTVCNLLHLDVQIDHAIRFLTEHIPVSHKDSRKPILPHNVRVGMRLREEYARYGCREWKYPVETVLAGFLHDTLEWSPVNETILREKFGEEVVGLVQANTKDDSLKDPIEKARELASRCASKGREALLIKAADILDSFCFYESMRNLGELKYCARSTDAIFEFISAEWKDSIFQDLLSWRERSLREENELNIS